MYKLQISKRLTVQVDNWEGKCIMITLNLNSTVQVIWAGFTISVSLLKKNGS